MVRDRKSQIAIRKSFRGRLMAGRLALNQQMEVRILSPKPFRFGNWDFGFGIERRKSEIRNPNSEIHISGRSTDGYMGLPWEQVFAGSNPAARTSTIWDLGLRIRDFKSAIPNANPKA